MAGLDVPRFERLCRMSGLVPVAKIEHRLGDIFIADGPVSSNIETGEPPHWCVIWAVQHRGVDIAQRFPMAWGSAPAERLIEAQRRAVEHLEATIH